MVRVNSQISLVSQGEFDFRQLFTCVATYKGTIVAVRKIRKKHVELTRNIKKELKMVIMQSGNLTNTENINEFLKMKHISMVTVNILKSPTI